jgi:hypothetical protein
MDWSSKGGDICMGSGQVRNPEYKLLAFKGFENT